MDAVEQEDYNIFGRDIYRVAIANQAPQNTRIVTSIGEDDDDEEFDDVEALRIAALQSLGSKNSYPKKSLSSPDIASTRRVSLGKGDESDLQIFSVERCDSVSSSSTDYEEIDLSAPSDGAVTEDKRTFHDSDESDSDLDIHNPDSKETFFSDSNGEEEDGTFETVRVYEAEDEDEWDSSVEGYEDNREIDNGNNDNVIGNGENLSYDNDIDNSIPGSGDIRNNMADSDEDFENNDGFSEHGDDHESTDLSQDVPVENVSDENVHDDIDENSLSDSDIVEDDNQFDSNDEINILNDISITIPNESLTALKADKHLERGNNEELENDAKIGHDYESDSKQKNHENVIYRQRIIVSHSDSGDENDSRVNDKNDENKQLAEYHSVKNKLPTVDRKDKNLHLSSSTASSDIVEKTPVNDSLDVVKTDMTMEKEKSVPNVIKTTDSVVKLPTVTGKKNLKPSIVGGPELGNATTSKIKKESSQETVKEKAGQRAKEAGNEKGKVQIQTKNVSVKAKAINEESKVVASSNNAAKSSATEAHQEEGMDFDQLSIEDEDSDFVEEEENLPAVKSKVGLNKIPTEHLRMKRSPSRENRRRRYSHSPGWSCSSVRPYRNRSSSRERQKDRRSFGRSREWNHRRSLSPRSRERNYRSSYSRSERSRSRDRMQNRLNSFVTKSRENRRYRSRSPSRSASRTANERGAKEPKSKLHGVKQSMRETIKPSVRDQLETKKEGNTRSLSPKKDLRARDDSVKKEPKLDPRIANCAKVESKPTSVQVTGVKIKQPKDLRSRISEKKVDPDLESLQKPTGKDSIEPNREKELDARIQRIKQQNEAILKRAKEIQAEKMKFS